MSTINDIAKIVGVNVATVSRVLNNRGYISENLKSRVYAAMEELNYQPNEIARSLSRKKSNVIGLIIPTISHPFFSAITEYIEYYAYKEGYKILLCISQLDAVKESNYISLLKASQVDSIIMASQTIDIANFDIHLPMVTFERKIGTIPYVCSDNYNGGMLATRLLIDKGCKNLAYIGGNLKLDMLSNARYKAFKDLCEENKIWNVSAQTEINGFNNDEYTKIISELFNDHTNIDGIFCSSDVIAAYVAKICINLKKRVPEDVRIIGYDGVDLGEIFTPAITTIRQSIKEMAEMLIELSIKQIAKKPVPDKVIFPVTLIERDTT